MADKEDPKKEDAKPADDGAAEEGDVAPKKSKKKLFILLGVAAAVVLGGGGAAAYLFMGHKKSEKELAEAAEAAKGKPVYFALGDLLVNLSGEGKHPNFLKVKISLELADEKDLPLMDTLKPRIVDSFQVYLRELRIEDLRGSAGLYRLREELLMRVTEAAQPVRVRDVLFQEMLVQ